ncbi:vitelline membrane outer layer protein 1-like [Leptodactylus fuscus]|uniref:vitelline membrane outer layer protein 1-like n=1 Tax=Leptodactylus fuscus TaxID=238119 RepID=UPI003F4F18EE
MFSSLTALLLLQATLIYGLWIEVDNGGRWGEWGPKQWCPPNTSARGFSLRMEWPLGVLGDDTSMNGIKLYCAYRGSTTPVATITSTVGHWGNWTSVSWCPKGKLLSFCLRVEEPQGKKDDTAANNIMMQCSDYNILVGNGTSWGRYGNWSTICYEGICGMQTKVEQPQGKRDDTSLNNVKFACCPTESLPAQLPETLPSTPAPTKLLHAQQLGALPGPYLLGPTEPLPAQQPETLPGPSTPGPTELLPAQKRETLPGHI